MPDHAGTHGRFGPFELMGELGRGGMGTVFRARDRRSGGPVALKLLPTGQDGPAQRARFLREGQAAARLRHPGIVPVLDVGEAEGRPYLAFQLIQGESLQAVLRREGRLAPERAARVARDLARALEFAHGQGVLHRDVKPANVLVDAAGRTWLADFGLAKVSDDLEHLTRTGQLMGTPGYLAPEQASGQPVGPAADIHGLGATLYALLTGVAPYRGTPLEQLTALTRGRPQAPSQLQAGVPAALDEVCLRSLQRDPARRYASAALVAEDLERFLAGAEPLSAASASRRRPGAASPGRPTSSGTVAGLLLLAGALAAALLGVAGRGGRAPLTARPGPPAPQPPGVPAGEPAPASSADAPASPAGRSSPGEAELRRGEASLEAGDLVGARAAFDAALAADPELAAAWSWRGRVRQKQDDLTGALRDHDRAVALDPASPDVWFARARARDAAGDLRGAIEDYGRTLALDPDDARCLTNRGLLHTRTGDLDRARRDLDRALELDPRSSLGWLGRGTLRLRQGDTDGAIADCDRALALEPELVPALTNRASARRTRGDLTGALQDLDRALELDPRQVDAWFNRANARLDAGDPRGAMEDCTRLLQLSPRDEGALAKRAEARLALGDRAGALRDLEQALTLVAPGSPAAATLRQRLQALQ